MTTQTWIAVLLGVAGTSFQLGHLCARYNDHDNYGLPAPRVGAPCSTSDTSASGPVFYGRITIGEASPDLDPPLLVGGARGEWVKLRGGSKWTSGSQIFNGDAIELRGEPPACFAP